MKKSSGKINKTDASGNKYAVGIVLWLLLLLISIAMIVVAFVVKAIATSGIWQYVCSGIGAIMSVVSLVGIIVCYKRLGRIQAESIQPLSVEIVQPQENKIEYIASENVYDFVNMGGKQKLEDKFAQIGLMDKTQFVIYIAKLFSLKGYQVRLTPVVDNRNIDMLVEKQGVTLAVGAIQADKVLSATDIEPIYAGLKYYPAGNVMALTNTYFDRTAVNYAKQNSMSLVDRTILSEDFLV